MTFGPACSQCGEPNTDVDAGGTCRKCGGYVVMSCTCGSRAMSWCPDDGMHPSGRPWGACEMICSDCESPVSG